MRRIALIALVLCVGCHRPKPIVATVLPPQPTLVLADCGKGWTFQSWWPQPSGLPASEVMKEVRIPDSTYWAVCTRTIP